MEHKSESWIATLHFVSFAMTDTFSSILSFVLCLLYYDGNMYEGKRIISTPISNNRLNWDERGDRTIVVPSLIEGTLDDVITGDETVIE